VRLLSPGRLGRSGCGTPSGGHVPGRLGIMRRRSPEQLGRPGCGITCGGHVARGLGIVRLRSPGRLRRPGIPSGGGVWASCDCSVRRLIPSGGGAATGLGIVRLLSPGLGITATEVMSAEGVMSPEGWASCELSRGRLGRPGIPSGGGSPAGWASCDCAVRDGSPRHPQRRWGRQRAGHRATAQSRTAETPRHPQRWYLQRAGHRATAQSRTRVTDGGDVRMMSPEGWASCDCSVADGWDAPASPARQRAGHRATAQSGLESPDVVSPTRRGLGIVRLLSPGRLRRPGIPSGGGVASGLGIVRLLSPGRLRRPGIPSGGGVASGLGIVRLRSPGG
jgi:hypothetical protein